MTTLLTRAALAAAPRVLIRGLAQSFLLPGDFRFCRQFIAAISPALAKISPAARAAGGSAFSNGAAGVFSFPPWPYQIVGFRNPISSGAPTQSIGVAIYDLMWAASGFAANTVAAQAVTAPVALPARAGTGAGCELMVSVATAGSGTATTCSVSYTNSAGVAGRTASSYTTISTPNAGLTYLLALQAGDAGVQSVQSLTFGTAGATAGDIVVSIVKPLAYCIGGDGDAKPEIFKSGFKEVDQNAALIIVGLPGGMPSAGTWEIELAQG